MSKLVFYFGAMNAGKSAKLLQMAYQTEGKKSFKVYTAQTNTTLIESRLGISRRCESIENLFKDTTQPLPKCIFIDECQWLTVEQVQRLRFYVDVLNIEVYCFGLRSDYEGKMFEGSQALFKVADKIEHLESYCDHCNNRAILHNKIEGKIGKEGFESVCYQHFKGDIL